MRHVQWMAIAVLAASMGCRPGDTRAPGGVATPATVVAAADRIIEPSLSPSGTLVAYWSPADTGAGYVMMVANSDFSSPRPSPLRGLLTQPLVWSPDGERIATFVGPSIGVFDAQRGTARSYPVPASRRIAISSWSASGEQLAVTEVDGNGGQRMSLLDLSTGNVRPLVAGERRNNKGWLVRGGRQVVYAVVEGNRSSIWVTDSVGGVGRPLTTEGFEAINSMQSLVSPDGKALAYKSYRSGRPDIYVVPLAGGPPRQLTSDVQDDDKPYWSPDGRFIVFTSKRGGQSDLWMVSREGGEAVRLTDSPEEETVIGWRRGGAGQPRDQLLFTSKGRTSTLVVRAVATGRDRPLVPDSLQLTNPWWVSPDRRLVAATFERAETASDLLVIDIASGTIRTTVRDIGPLQSLAWSPDGSAIVVTSLRSGNSNILRIGVPDGKLSELTANRKQNQDRWGVFSRDGRTVYYLSREGSSGPLWNVWKVPATGGVPERVTTSGMFVRLIPSMPLGPVALQPPPGDRMTEGRVQFDRRGVPIPTLTGSGGDFAVSPTGDSVAVIVREGGRQSIRLMPTSGGQGRELMNGEAEPNQVSPDGRHLLFMVRRGINWQTALLDLDTGTQRGLTTLPDVSEYGAEFTASADTIVLKQERIRQRILTLPAPGAGKR